MDEVALRGFLARILGWSAAQAVAVENALRAIHLSVTHCAALVLLGESDLVPIAQALHRRILGAERPFVVCDPRRGDVHPSVRSPLSRGTGLAAFEAARGGTMCVRLRRLPRDFSTVVMLAREPGVDVRIVICADARYDRHPFLAIPPPIRVPDLKARESELPRIVAEYALDALSALDAGPAGFTEADRRWVLDHSAATLADIEKATLRRAALRLETTSTQAAERLGMSGVALRQWISRRRRAARRAARRGGRP